MKVKCKFCHEEIDKESAYVIQGNKNNSYFCNEEHYIKSINKEKYEPIEGNPRRELTDLILSYYEEQGIDKHNINWSIETARIKNILDEPTHTDWTLTGLTYTLHYMHDVEKVNLFNEESNCVMALVPFYYVKAMQFYYESIDVEEAISNFEMKDEVVVIHKTRKEEKRKVEW